MIVAFGEWVLHTACRQAVEWRDQGLGDICVSIRSACTAPSRIHRVDAFDAAAVRHPNRARRFRHRLRVADLLVLQRLGCRTMQGYLYGRPAAAHEVTALVSTSIADIDASAAGANCGVANQPGAKNDERRTSILALIGAPTFSCLPPSWQASHWRSWPAARRDSSRSRFRSSC